MPKNYNAFNEEKGSDNRNNVSQEINRSLEQQNHKPGFVQSSFIGNLNNPNSNFEQNVFISDLPQGMNLYSKIYKFFHSRFFLFFVIFQLFLVGYYGLYILLVDLQYTENNQVLQNQSPTNSNLNSTQSTNVSSPGTSKFKFSEPKREGVLYLIFIISITLYIILSLFELLFWVIFKIQSDKHEQKYIEFSKFLLITPISIFFGMISLYYFFQRKETDKEENGNIKGLIEGVFCCLFIVISIIAILLKIFEYKSKTKNSKIDEVSFVYNFNEIY